MRKRTLQFAPKREINYIEYGLDEAVRTLNDYLKDKIVIIADDGRRRKQPKYNKTDKLIFSCAFTCRRIIRKYSRGEVPNMNRMKIWDTILKIIAKLEADNVLPTIKTEKWRHKTLVFRCKVYEHKNFIIVIPQEPPKKKMPFRRAKDNPVMEQQFPNSITEKRSNMIILEYSNRQFT